MPTHKSQKLLIVESPAKAKTIEKYLDHKYKVLASVGHIRDLPKSNKKAINIPGGFIPHYEIVSGKESVVDTLKKEAHKADEVLLATDPDREGEAIAWHIQELCKIPDAKRVVFYEITKEAIQEALKHPRPIDGNLKQAQEARRVLDRLVGYDLSGLIWKKLRYGLSAGRVQSPALRILMERERDIRAFIPEAYWVITALFRTKNKEELRLTVEEFPKEKAVAERIVAEGKKATWHIADISEKDVALSPRPPFITSTLQQAANSRLGFSPSRTMMLAQKLYEAGHITYMRTDSTNIAESAKKEILSTITAEFGGEYAEIRTYKTKSKTAQEAHEAIRPTHINVKNPRVTGEQKKLYDLIRARTLASQMKDAQTKRTQVVAAADCDIPHFIGRGTRITFPGWLAAYPFTGTEETLLPRVSVNEPLTLLSLESQGEETKPPKRYTEAGLIKELEKREIGRPSTYATIVKTLLDRGYARKEGRTLFPTDTGEVVNDFLELNFKEYISDSFTSEMERELDEIADGKRSYAKTLKEFYAPFQEKIKEKEDIPKITTLGDADKKFTCPICKGPMVIKLGRGGKFLSCKKFPECTGSRTIDGNEMKEPEATGENCPKCESGHLVRKTGRFGEFIACSNYPKCSYVKNDGERPAHERSGVTCPECKKGEIVARRGRFGVFWSCSEYPSCKFALKAKPTGNICKLCGSLQMEGTKTIPERCSNKSCPNHNPHKNP